MRYTSRGSEAAASHRTAANGIENWDNDTFTLLSHFPEWAKVPAAATAESLLSSLKPSNPALELSTLRCGMWKLELPLPGL